MNIDEHFYINKTDLPSINIFLNYSYNLMNGLNYISFQNIIINYMKQCKYKWTKRDTLNHNNNKNELIINWLNK